MHEALALARRSFTTGGGPFGAVIVRSGEIIGSGMSLARRTHDPTAHAEVLAVRAAAHELKRIDLSDCILYSSAEPCPMCLAACYWSRIATIYYGTSSGDAAQFGFEDLYVYQELAKPTESRAMHSYPLLRDEALPLLSESHRLKPYDSFLPSGWRRCG
jgi:guanine deaminase